MRALLICISEFTLTDELKQGIREAQQQFRDVTSSLAMNFIQYDKVGKNLLKQHKLGPDSFMQLAFQVGVEIYHNYGTTGWF